MASPVFPHERLTRKHYVDFAAAARRKRRRKRQSIRTPTQTLYDTIRPDVMGMQKVGKRLRDGQTVGIPTDCSYEAVQYVDVCSSSRPCNNNNNNKTVPHIYCDLFSLQNHPFWKQWFPKKAYGIRSHSHNTKNSHQQSRRRSNSMDSTCTVDRTGTHKQRRQQQQPLAYFNESLQVLLRFLGQTWPGPVLVQLQVPQALPGWTLSDDNNKHYLLLRTAVHPLTVRVLSECMPLPSPILTPRSPKTTIPSRLVLTPPVTPIPSDTTNHKNADSQTSNNNNTQKMLVGTPLLDDNGHFIKSCLDCRYSSTVQLEAVLDGEYRLETLSVPTCENKGYKRMVVNYHQRTIAVDDPSLASGLWTEALRACGAQNSATLGDRLIHAVLLKWKVVELSSLSSLSEP